MQRPGVGSYLPSKPIWPQEEVPDSWRDRRVGSVDQARSAPSRPRARGSREKTKPQPRLVSTSWCGLLPERPEWSIRRGVDRVPGLRIGAEVEPQEFLII